MKNIMILILLAVSTTSYADIRLTWDVPTKREDGSPLLRSEISHYQLWFKTPTKRGYKTPKGGTSGYCFLTKVNGQYEFCIRTVDKGGLVSDCSNIIRPIHTSQSTCEIKSPI